MHWQKASSQIIIRRQKILNMRKFSQIIQTGISQIRLIVKSPSSAQMKDRNSCILAKDGFFSTNRVQVTEF